MRFVWPILWRVRSLFSRKLGVCPFCMRTSGLGALTAWALYAAAAIASPRPVVMTVLLIAAAAFTLLMSAHIVAYVVRVVMRVRAAERSVESSAERPHSGLGRREFLDLVLRAGVYAIIFSLPGAARVFAGAIACAGEHGQVNNPAAEEIAASAAELGRAQEALARLAKQVCDNYCADLTQHFGCVPGTSTCVQTQAPVVHWECAPSPLGGSFECRGSVKSCFCGCNSCHGVYKPIPPDDVAEGPTDAGMQANADTKCQQLCAKLKDCLPPDVCTMFERNLGKPKHTSPNGQPKVTAPILSCRCECPLP